MSMPGRHGPAWTIIGAPLHNTQVAQDGGSNSAWVDVTLRSTYEVLKQQAVEVIQRFLETSLTELGCSTYPREIRTDNGSEFQNDALADYLLKRGITAVYRE